MSTINNTLLVDTHRHINSVNITSSIGNGWGQIQNISVHCLMMKNGIKSLLQRINTDEHLDTSENKLW